MNLFDYVRPLPNGVTTSSIRRAKAILAQVSEPEKLVVRIFGMEHALGLQTLLQQQLPHTTVLVYVYPISNDVEVELMIDGQFLAIKKCNIEATGDILKPVIVDESLRRRWREVIQGLWQEPVVIDLPTVESHSLLFRWFKEAEARLGKPLLMDDYIDALFAMLQVKVASPVDEDYIVRTTAQAGVMFVGSLKGIDPVTLQRSLAMTKAMFVKGMSLTPETLAALDTVIWSQDDQIHD